MLKTITKPFTELSDKHKGVLMMLLAAFFYSVMSISVKMALDIPIYEKFFFRNVFSIGFAYYLVKKNGVSLLGHKGNRLLLNLRTFFGMLGVLTMFYALERIDVATAMTMKNLSQIWILILASLFLNEKIDSKHYLFIFIAFVGVVIVSKPSAPSVWFPTLVCLVSSLFTGVSFTAISKLKGREHPTTIVFYFSLVTTLIMLVPTILTFEMISGYNMVLMFITGFSAMCAQIFMTQAYHYAAAADVSIYSYMGTVFSALMEMFIWQHIPDLWNVLGMFLIVFASYFSSVRLKATENVTT